MLLLHITKTNIKPMQSNKTLPEFSWEVFSWQMLILIGIFLMFYALRNISKSNIDGKQKLIWTLLIIFLPLFGPTLYLLKKRS